MVAFVVHYGVGALSQCNGSRGRESIHSQVRNFKVADALCARNAALLTLRPQRISCAMNAIRSKRNICSRAPYVVVG